MSKHDVRDVAGALAYMTDCALATVCTLAMRKAPPKAELARQVGIAQAGLDWMDRFGVDYSKTRGAEVKAAGGKVAVWAEKYREPAA